jgi:hypothetical protein
MSVVSIGSCKVVDDKTRNQAIKIIETVYRLEKKWIDLAEVEIPPDIGNLTKYSWFLATVDGKPAGVIRINYDLSLEFPPEFGVTLNAGIDLKQIAQRYRIVELGRFMILPEFRSNIRVALRLIGAALIEIVARKYTHILADVFEDDQTSPLKFLTKILGFEVIGSHPKGELNCTSNRLILVFDIHKGYRQLKDRKNPGLVRVVQKELLALYEQSIHSTADLISATGLLPLQPKV